MSPCAELIRELSQPLEPLATGVEPRLPRLEGVRAVLLDVYGTLLISASGDISVATGAARGDAAEAALRDAGAAVSVPGETIVERLHQTIHDHHAALANQTDYPEVDILEVWRAVVRDLCGPETDVDLPRLATAYECRVNPVWPMPGAADCLAALRSAGLALGVVSNAQFFTPVALETLLGASLAELGFADDLCEWSYRRLRAKPGLFLYERAAEKLAAHGVPPDATLYVGNDMRNDVAPAARLGFRTALFAGDARSLRWREDDPAARAVRPDAVLTRLEQIPTILSLAGV